MSRHVLDRAPRYGRRSVGSFSASALIDQARTAARDCSEAVHNLDVLAPCPGHPTRTRPLLIADSSRDRFSDSVLACWTTPVAPTRGSVTERPSGRGPRAASQRNEPCSVGPVGRHATQWRRAECRDAKDGPPDVSVV